jgi:membrane fusion protein (multidrug efflux system)
METQVNKTEKKQTKKGVKIGIIIMVLLAAAWITKVVIHSACYEETDNAQIDGNIVPIRSTVGGYVEKINVTENQLVKEGDTLIVFDVRDLREQVAQAEARLETALASLETTRIAISSVRFSTDAAQYGSEAAKETMVTSNSKLWQAQNDFERVQKMYEKGAVTQQAFDAARTGLDVAKAQLEVAENQYKSAGAQKQNASTQIDMQLLKVKLSEAQVKEARAQLALTRLQYDRAFVTSPCNGIVSKRNVNEGQLITAGTSLITVVDVENLWITANFKETQIGKLNPGQRVKVEIDAYPKAEVAGEVQSVCGATGAKFSLLPADNASGNFVKVTQRIPVKILITKAENLGTNLLYPGMNVIVDVKTR